MKTITLPGVHTTNSDSYDNQLGLRLPKPTQFSLRYARAKSVSHETLFIVIFARDTKHILLIVAVVFCLRCGGYFCVPISSSRNSHLTWGRDLTPLFCFASYDSPGPSAPSPPHSSSLSSQVRIFPSLTCYAISCAITITVPFLPCELTHLWSGLFWHGKSQPFSATFRSHSPRSARISNSPNHECDLDSRIHQPLWSDDDWTDDPSVVSGVEFVGQTF